MPIAIRIASRRGLGRAIPRRSRTSRPRPTHRRSAAARRATPLRQFDRLRCGLRRDGFRFGDVRSRLIARVSVIGVFRHGRISTGESGGAALQLLTLMRLGFCFGTTTIRRMIGPARLYRLSLDRSGERVGGFKGSLGAGRAHTQALSRNVDLDTLRIHVRNRDANFVAIRDGRAPARFRIRRARRATPSRDEHLVEKFVERSFEILKRLFPRACHRPISRQILAQF